MLSDSLLTRNPTTAIWLILLWSDGLKYLSCNENILTRKKMDARWCQQYCWRIEAGVKTEGEGDEVAMLKVRKQRPK